MEETDLPEFRSWDHLSQKLQTLSMSRRSWSPRGYSDVTISADATQGIRSERKSLASPFLLPKGAWMMKPVDDFPFFHLQKQSRAEGSE